MRQGASPSRRPFRKGAPSRRRRRFHAVHADVGRPHQGHGAHQVESANGSGRNPEMGAARPGSRLQIAPQRLIRQCAGRQQNESLPPRRIALPQARTASPCGRLWPHSPAALPTVPPDFDSPCRKSDPLRPGCAPACCTGPPPGYRHPPAAAALLPQGCSPKSAASHQRHSFLFHADRLLPVIAAVPVPGRGSPPPPRRRKPDRPCRRDYTPGRCGRE